MKNNKNLDKQINYPSKESISIEKINNHITNLYKEINNLYIKLNQKEDDIKNIINEKDNIIKKMENKILNQEKIITKNKIEISNLNYKIEELVLKFNSELQDKKNTIKSIHNKISQMETNYLYNELKNEEKTFEFEASSSLVENNSDKYQNKNYESIVYSIIKLNPVIFKNVNKKIILNLIAIGFSDNQIIILNMVSMKVHQKIKTSNSVYSLCQFNNNSNYLFGSLSNGLIMIYELNNGKFEEKQQLEKPEDCKYGEINKVITLSNGDLASAERGAISIWTKNIYEINKYQFYKEIKTEDDTCQLIEVNPYVFACAIYKPKIIKVFKREDYNYPLIGYFENCHSHGNNSNSMAKLNDNLFCSGGNFFIYIVSVEPVELKKIIEVETYGEIKFTYVINNYLFTAQDSNIIQYSININEKNHCINLEQIKILKNFKNQRCNALAITEEGKIFYEIKEIGNKRKFILTNY